MNLPNPELPASKNSFTLLELLIVIGIIALIAGIGIPAFNNINQGANMRAAERQVMAAVFMTRQQSVVQRQRIFFGIPHTIRLTTNGYIRSNMLSRCYLMMSEENKSISPRPSSIIGKVEMLP